MMNLNLYISGMGTISSQGIGNKVEIQEAILEEVIHAMDAAYEEYISPALLRRMSRVIKMGVTTGLMALKNAQCSMPSAMIAGTGYGCLEDTNTFLTKLIRQQEEGLNPTPFIQSTHNTISAQLALMLKCYGYNQTYSQQGYSFEQTLVDADLQLRQKPQYKILVTGVDESTVASESILGKLDCFQSFSRGEGATSFVVSGEETENTFCKITKLVMMPTVKKNRLSKEDLLLSIDGNIDLILTPYETSLEGWDKSRVYYYGNSVGEFPTRSGFSLALAASFIKDNKSFQRVVIHNSFTGRDHSLVVVESCQKIPR
jgi:3-oxoacyl-[acyl-carrier-protein] synthase II